MEGKKWHVFHSSTTRNISVASNQPSYRLNRRVFVSDTNKNRLWLVDEHGSNYRYLDLQQTTFGSASTILFPTDVAARLAGDNVEIFVAEYLGELFQSSVYFSWSD